MKKISPVAVKLIFIGLIIGVLCIANCLIGGKMKERKNTYDDAQYSISSSAGGSFYIKDVCIAIPYKQTYQGVEQDKIITKTRKGFKVITPEKVKYDADLQSEVRTLGIYKAPVYTGKLEINSSFNLGEIHNTYDTDYFLSEAMVIIPISSSSLLDKPVFEINRTNNPTFYYSCNSDYVNDFDGIACSFNASTSGVYNFSTTLDIRGSLSFMVKLDSAETKLKIKSDWTAPGFTNSAFLPDTRELTDDGFTANWSVPFTSSNSYSSIGFDFVEPVNLYKKLDRAQNYAFLFIIVPFIILFIFEIFASINLHPVHYLLSGAASVIFFLLLLSISEHLNFSAAYIIGALASGLLVSLYVMSITKKIKLGGIMSVMFVLLYGYLFFCLQSEDYALLMGSIFAFTILAGIMFVTRKVNWANLKKNDHTDLIKV